MIIGQNREKVIENIKNAVACGDFYAKTELDDPVLTTERENEITENYMKSCNSLGYKFKRFFARIIASILTKIINQDTEIVGIEKLKDISGGAFITSNHFSPLENTCVRYLAKKMGKRHISIVSQVTNFAMTGFIGFFMNYADTVPISHDSHYVNRTLTDILTKLVNKGEYVLIYPEQEMWFNYRKPRPFKRGAYFYAAKAMKPVISCFVEQIDTDKAENEQFYKVKYRVHVLDVIYPDAEKSVRENSFYMVQRDEQLKREAYEKAYNKPLDYTFENSDIAGWRYEK